MFQLLRCSSIALALSCCSLTPHQYKRAFLAPLCCIIITIIQLLGCPDIYVPYFTYNEHPIHLPRTSPSSTTHIQPTASSAWQMRRQRTQTGPSTIPASSGMISNQEESKTVCLILKVQIVPYHAIRETFNG